MEPPRWIGAFVVAACIAGPVGAQDVDDGSPDLEPDEALEFVDLDLEQLLQIEVTSVAGVARPLGETPSALSVITNEDIRRGGHRSIASALRLVPGFDVRQIDASAWSVSSRGFTGLFSNKLLVLMDGRPLYDPMFAGTFWDVQDTLLEDVDRIEAIRGPGATLWGSNAVNGVINITTKSARDTVGTFITGGGGTEETGFGAFRHGLELDDRSWIRVWAKYDARDTTDIVGGGEASDDWGKWHGGARYDLEGEDGFSLTVESSAYATTHLGESTRVPQRTTLPSNVIRVRDGRASGGHVLARAGRSADDGGWQVLTYYDRTERIQADGFNVERDTVSMELRNWTRWGEGHELIAGAEFRHTRDQTTGNDFLSFEPAARSDNLFSGFLQNTFALEEDRWFAMVGAKLEHNDYTGFEVQPSGRLWWMPDASNTVWASVSRAVRTPARTDHDVRLDLAYADAGVLGGGAPVGQIVPIQLTGNPDMRSEELLAWEVGWRTEVNEALSFDLAAFYNDYDRLTLTDATGGMQNNFGEAESYGVEAEFSYRIAPNWRLAGSYSAIDLQVSGPGPANDEREHPHHMARLQSYLDLTDDLELNVLFYFDDRIAEFDLDPSYTLDVGMTWRFAPNADLSIWGTNLLDGSRAGAVEPLFHGREHAIERGVHAAISIRF